MKNKLIMLLGILSCSSLFAATAPKVIANIENHLPVKTTKDGEVHLAMTFKRSDYPTFDSKYSVSLGLDDIKLPDGWSWHENGKQCADELYDTDRMSSLTFPCKLRLVYSPKQVTPFSSFDVPYTYTITGADGSVVTATEHLTITYSALGKWGVQVSDSYAYPALDEKNKLVYFTPNSKTLAAYDLEGIQQWTVTDEKGFGFPVVSAAHELYIASRDTVYAINSDGKIKWQFSFVNPDRYSFPPKIVVSDKNVVYFGVDYDLYAVNASGILQSKFTLPIIVNQIAFGKLGEMFVQGCGEICSTYRINANNEVERLHGNTDQTYAAPIVAADGSYYQIINTTLRAFTVEGKLKWSRAKANVFTSPAVDREGNVYFNCDVSTYGYTCIAALTPDGNEKWVSKLAGRAGEVMNLSVGKDGKVYVLAEDANWYAPWHLFALNPSSAEIDQDYGFIHSYSGRYTTAPLFGSDGTIYLQSMETNITLPHSNSDKTPSYVYAIKTN